MAKNNQKKEKALRNKENARKYRKKPTFGRNQRGGGKFGGGPPSASPPPASSPSPQ